MRLRECFLTENRCYIQDAKMEPIGIVVHSTGCNNPTLKRYVQPDDGQLGKNKYNNSWNRPDLSVCVNAFIGKLEDGTVATYQTLPWTTKPWGCGSGKNGSYNNSHIQFEICEDALTDEDYMWATFNEAAELCAYLCELYSIDPSNIVSHKEAYKAGYASNHGDPESWWTKKFGVTMDDFRAEVTALLNPYTVDLTDEQCYEIVTRAQKYADSKNS